MGELKKNEAQFHLSGASCLLCLVLLLLMGTGYNAAAHKLKAAARSAILLPMPLKTIPLVINDWNGKDIQLPETVIKAASNDDYVNRLYINRNSNMWVNIYIAYSARPRTMLGHRPDICYVGAGWVCDSSENSSFRTSAGQELPCLIHRFHKPDGSGDEMVVLNFYMVNGLVSADEKLFSGLQWRTPNIAGNPARYVAQIQISSSVETTVRRTAAELSPTMMSFLPDEKGNVNALLRAAANTDIVGEKVQVGN
ncbi:MAG: hypothetical protein A2Y07_07825 [Planctomycetes bacterium GWF2_50_10]|nr:MAG: hypothetical protein A2Y07_07825 [Planctomycetes bacterium GWF2_50_10]